MKRKAKPMPGRSRPSSPRKVTELRTAGPAPVPGALRRAAEARLKERLVARRHETVAHPKTFQHELEVHQVELEMQNEELRRTQAELETALERYAEFYEFSPASYLTLRPDGTIRQANLAAASLLGIERSRLLRRPLGVFVAAEARATFAALLTRAFETRAPQTGEVRLSLDGKPPLTIHLRAWVSKNESECRLVLTDLTERVRAEAALRENEERYRGIFDESVAAVYVFDNQKQFINANQAGLDLLGYSREELLHLSIPDVDADPAVVLPAHQELLSGGRLINYEHRLRRKDGAIITVLNNSRPITDQQGNVVRLVSTLIDITRRKRAEAALHEHEQRHQTILRTAMDGFLRVDLNGHVLEVNEAYCRMSGYTEPELLAMSISDLEAVETPADTAAHIQGILRQGEDRFESWHRRKNGSRFAVEASVQYKQEQGGYQVAFLRDITERKRTEEALQHLSARLVQLRDQERRHIARELHDSTVQDLAAIVVNLSFMRKTVHRLSREAQQALLDSLALADRAAKGLRTLTYLLHPPLLEELGLAGALRDFVDGFARRSRICMDLVLAPALGRLPEEIELALFRIVQESLANILKHSGSDSARIELYQTTDEIRLEVRDAGHGFPLNSSQSAGRTPGLGVGITGMQERLRQLGGRLEITSTSGGTIVRATLPRPRPEPGNSP